MSTSNFDVDLSIDDLEQLMIRHSDRNQSALIDGLARSYIMYEAYESGDPYGIQENA